jgi:hypothetical protein
LKRVKVGVDDSWTIMQFVGCVEAKGFEIKGAQITDEICIDFGV